MLEQRQTIDDPGIRRSGGQHVTQKTADRRGGQRHAARIIDLDIPAPQERRDTRGEIAVGRDERRGFVLLFQSTPHQKCDRLRFFLRVIERQAAKMIQRRARNILFLQIAPGLGDLGGTHRFLQQTDARRVLRVGRRPQFDIAARSVLRSLQQHLHAVLGMHLR